MPSFSSTVLGASAIRKFFTAFEAQRQVRGQPNLLVAAAMSRYQSSKLKGGPFAPLALARSTMGASGAARLLWQAFHTLLQLNSRLTLAHIH
jgi:hypothetical protein